MSDQSRHSRALPEQPSLRYLKIEAKRRLAAGEFNNLHDAQLTIAREHGQSSWTTLKAAIEAAEGRSSHALTQVRWVVARFRAAGRPAWVAPDEAELREHFVEYFLSQIPADTVIDTLRTVADRLGAEPVVLDATPRTVRAQVADLRIEAAAESDPPHRLTGLRVYPVGGRITDHRLTGSATHTSGAVPDGVARVAEESVAELGLVGLVLAGATRTDERQRPAPWTVVRGWADLDRPEPLRADHRLPAYGLTKLITSTALLCLVADGRAELDGPANDYLRTLRLADDGVTIRELLTYTGGVASPREQFADQVPDPVGLLGRTVACDTERGTFAASNGSYAVLGQLLADVTGEPFPDAVTRLVLEPLGMSGSWFPTRWPATDVITGYNLTGDGSFEPAPRQVNTMPAAGGLWTTGIDLVRFGLGWSALLPEELSREALRSHAAQRTPGADVGLGWLVNRAEGVHGHPGVGPGAATSLIIRSETGTVTVAATNRAVPIEPVNARLIRPTA